MRGSKLMLQAAFVICACGALAFGQASSPNSRAKKTSSQKDNKTASATAPATGKDSIVDSMDKSADPCVDFYQYACGGWRKKNPLPSDQSNYGRFAELAERNNLILKDILEKDAPNVSRSRSAVDQKIGDFYAACMDESAINKKGLDALKPELDGINGIKSKRDLEDVVISLHKEGTPGLFDYSSQQDFKNASKEIAAIDQGGMGLPSKEYYTKTDPKSVETREKYLEHVRKMLALSGYSPKQAVAGAKAVMNIETALAQGSLAPVERRDPQKIYHPTSVADLQQEAPAFDWKRYITGVGTPPVESVNVVAPAYMTALNGVINNTSLDDLKTYLRWHLLRDAAPFLPDAFVNENFDFYGKTLRGAKEIRPRWKRCVRFTDNALGEALGIAYVQRTFGKEGKDRMLQLVHNVETALRNDISTLDWMTAATKKEALIKLEAIANKIGYPEKWRDYSSVKIDAHDALGNAQRASEFEFKRQLDKIGKPVDKQEWGMTPPTVNAYYDPLMNNINFPAGILQPPFFDKNQDDAVNYGAVAVVIGHELTHGFDDEGRQFDPQGNLRDWWTPADAKAFEERATCIADQYSSYTAVDDVKVNGKLTLGENAADNGGIHIAHMALMETPEGKANKSIDGFSRDQRFFIGYAQMWCENATDQATRLLAQTNPHSPGRWRVVGAISNMPEFRTAFGCKVGQPMVPAKECRIW